MRRLFSKTIMTIKSNYIKPKFKKESNPKIGLLALSTDLTIERDFNSICSLFDNFLSLHNAIDFLIDSHL